MASQFWYPPLFTEGINRLCLPFSAISWQSETSSGDRGEGAPLVSLPKGMLLLVGVVAFCTTVGEGGMVDWSSTFMIEVTNVTEAKAALGFTAYSVMMVITRLLGDRCIQAIGPVNMTRISGVVAAVGALLAVAGARSDKMARENNVGW